MEHDCTKMQVVVICGGVGSRMKPLTNSCPKIMLPLLGRPFALWQLDFLKEQGADEVLYLIGHLGDKVRELGDNYQGIKLRYSQEFEPLGKLDAILHALPMLRPWFACLYGDSIPLGVNLRAMAQHFLYGGKQLRMISTWGGIDHGVSMFRRSYFEWESYPAKHKYLEIGSPEGLAETEAYLKQKEKV